MTSVKFAKNIAKYLLCKPEKKREIMEQIKSDIEIAIQNGKTLQEAIDDMGNPKDIAKEFNENFDEKEKKAFKRKKNLIIIVPIIVIFAALIAYTIYISPKSYNLGKSGMFDKDKIMEQSELIISYLDKNDIEGMKPYVADVMLDVVNEKNMKNAKAQISDNFGQFLNYGNTYTYEVKQSNKWYAVSQITVSYENAVVTYTLSFDPDMKLSGLYMK